MPTALLLAPLPALIGCLLLMQWAAVSRTLIVQHIVIASGALAVCAGICALTRRRVQSPSIALTVCVIALIALCATLVTAADSSPTRWISLGGFRLYVAALVLPTAVFLLAHSLSNAATHKFWPRALMIGIAAILAVQPDLSQASAFAAACSFALWRTHATSRDNAFALLALAASVVAAWMQPDPLKPVPYVEGVLELAQSAGVFALIGAVIAVACVPICLAWRGVGTRSTARLAVAIYYVVIDVMAALQLTPMPHLGFGASPILGYFCMVAFAASGDEETSKL